MAIKYVSGDLFENEYKAQAFAHGCNCQGAMGAGIAREFRNRYPEMYAEYRQLCKNRPRQFNPGELFLWKPEDEPWIFNLATQEDFRRHRATYVAIEKSMETMKQQADLENIRSIAIPRIGSGYGGLPWEKVKPIIEDVFHDWDGTLFIYEEFVKDK
jgi:O-acetyl-ADP-ribose deacetylase (regulator of RNase III)